MTPVNCHRCKERGEVIVTPCDAGVQYGYVVYCRSCSGGEYEVSHGGTKKEAIEVWAEAVAERIEDTTDPLPGNAP